MHDVRTGETDVIMKGREVRIDRPEEKFRKTMNGDYQFLSISLDKGSVSCSYSTSTLGPDYQHVAQ
jgi:hypothetical protein